jgi:hypothetical protein
MKPAIEHIDISRDELEQLLNRAREALPEEDYRKLKAAVDALSYLTELVADKDTTIRDLRQLLLPGTTEKTREVLRKLGVDVSRPNEQANTEVKKKPGHGRHAADEYRGAQKVAVPHESITAGGRCPGCPVVIRARSTNNRTPNNWCGSSGRRRFTR